MKSAVVPSKRLAEPPDDARRAGATASSSRLVGSAAASRRAAGRRGRRTRPRRRSGSSGRSGARREARTSSCRPSETAARTRSYVLPAEELLEAEELADLEVDDAEVLDPLVDALGRLEGMDRQARDAVVDDAVAAEVVERSGDGGSALPAERDGIDVAASVRRLALILPPWCAIRRSSDRTFRRSSSAPKGLARKSEPPSCIAVMRSLTSERPVRNSTGTSRVVDWRRRIAQNSQPRHARAC